MGQDNIYRERPRGSFIVGQDNIYRNKARGVTLEVPAGTFPITDKTPSKYLSEAPTPSSTTFSSLIITLRLLIDTNRSPVIISLVREEERITQPNTVWRLSVSGYRLGVTGGGERGRRTMH